MATAVGVVRAGATAAASIAGTCDAPAEGAPAAG
eukprot:COSAG03_NODE_12876_length_526_cov_567.398126_1_plen_33_part_01